MFWLWLAYEAGGGGNGNSPCPNSPVLQQVHTGSNPMSTNAEIAIITMLSIFILGMIILFIWCARHPYKCSEEVPEAKKSEISDTAEIPNDAQITLMPPTYMQNIPFTGHKIRSGEVAGSPRWVRCMYSNGPFGGGYYDTDGERLG